MRSPNRCRHAAGTAYVYAAGGSVAWNAVSKQATWGMPPSAAAVAVIPARARGWCNGASEVRAPIPARTSSFTSVASV